jgi:prolipoprotein diacylglyceryl transferase
MHQALASIPSPSTGVWHLWLIPLRGYALMIILGVIVAVWLTERRWVARGGQGGVAVDVAVWAVPFGLLGGRIYHVITDWELYFGEAGRPLDSVMIWKGGLGIWGAIALGGVGAWIGCRQRGVSLRAFADAAAPGIVLAQGIGRWGNWFNQELFGKPTSLPWGLEIDPGRAGSIPGELTYHPTFLYEFLWCVGVAVLVIWAERRFGLGYGRTFALYVAAYTVGRFWIELLRIDQAHEIFGMRLNAWTSIVVFLGAVGYLIAYRGRTTTRLEMDEPARAEVAEPATVAAGAAGAAGAGMATGADATDATDAQGQPAAEADADAEAWADEATEEATDDAAVTAGGPDSDEADEVEPAAPEDAEREDGDETDAGDDDGAADEDGDGASDTYGDAEESDAGEAPRKEPSNESQ